LVVGFDIIAYRVSVRFLALFLGITGFLLNCKYNLIIGIGQEAGKR
jgi:hypothetical protein